MEKYVQPPEFPTSVNKRFSYRYSLKIYVKRIIHITDSVFITEVKEFINKIVFLTGKLFI